MPNVRAAGCPRPWPARRCAGPAAVRHAAAPPAPGFPRPRQERRAASQTASKAASRAVCTWYQRVVSSGDCPVARRWRFPLRWDCRRLTAGIEVPSPGWGVSRRGTGQVAQKVTRKLVDDLDGSPAVATVRFGYDGHDYEIELSEAHAAELDEFLAPYLEHA